MPKLSLKWPVDKHSLYQLGVERVKLFCEVNSIPCPTFNPVEQSDWMFDACGYYRPQTITICVAKCAAVCGEAESRNWNWPCSTTDREPFGVLAHELGHHCDWLAGKNKWSYGSEYSTEVRVESGESPITGYCPNAAEWFAECFRLMVTNPQLLNHIRPKTYAILSERWKPCIELDWRKALGVNVPKRVIRTLMNKGAV